MPNTTEKQSNVVRLRDRSNVEAKGFINRELSFIAFNERVLELAQDPNVPLLERLRYLAIFSSNLDEFFEVRVAGLKEREHLELASPYPDGQSPTSLLRQISDRCHALIESQYQTLNEDLLPALTKEGIQVLKRNALTPRQKE